MTNRSDCVLIQQASGEYRDLLALTVPYHLEYCLTHDIDYWPIFGEARSRFSEQLPHFDRVSLIKIALEAGYEKIVWLDADCVLNWQAEADLRDAIPDAGIGALWCEGEWTDPLQYNHWCTGALYVHNDLMSVGFVESWQCCTGVEHGWQDQHAFNGILKNEWVCTGVVQPISRHWHSILPDFMPADEQVPMVVAFHGYGTVQDRRDIMEALIEHMHQSKPFVQLNTELFSITAARAGLVSAQTVAHLQMLVDYLQKCLSLPGDVIECGVFRGGTSAVLLQASHDSSKRFLLCDTFTGMPARGEEDVWLGEGQLADTSVELVRIGLQILRESERAELIPGLFADTLPTLADRRFCFAHIDADYYYSTRQALEFIWPRLAVGGWVLFHDYGDPEFPGIAQAVQEILHRVPDGLYKCMAAFQKREEVQR